MSAREELIEALLPSYRSQWAHGEEEAAIAIVDAFAHELAEKIRNSPRLIEYTDDHMSDMYEAADEIDPEVQR